MDEPKFSEEQIEFMRQDLASNMSLSRMIDSVKKRFADEGRDFDAEFEQFQVGQRT